MESFAETLSALGGAAFRWSALAFLLVNGLATAAVLITRNRGLVNRWTPRLLVLNLLLVGTGVVIPALAYSMKAVVQAVSTSSGMEVHIKEK